jgi:hypothetical protein
MRIKEPAREASWRLFGHAEQASRPETLPGYGETMRDPE